MKNLPFFLIVALAGTTLATAQQTTLPEEPTMPQGTFSHYYASVQAYKVTIESEKGVVTVLEVPAGGSPAPATARSQPTISAKRTRQTISA